MKTSTKNTIIAGVFSIIGACAGSNFQVIKIENNIEQRGFSTNNENLINNVDDLLDEYTKIQTDYNSLKVDYLTIESKYEMLLSENNDLLNKIDTLQDINEEISKKIIVQESIENSEVPSVEPDLYLFDQDPFMVDHVNLYMRNNNRDTIYQKGTFAYDTGFRMVSNGQKYEKGMSITPMSNYQSSIYYNLNREYSNLFGMIAFEDKYSDRIDKNYDIFFYCDDKYIDAVTINKGSSPQEFSINVANCNILKIVLERPNGDKSDNPNINLIEFRLFK